MRRLAAIMSADIVCPLLASGEPEQATFGRLEASHHDPITEEITKHGGHIVAVSGDNFLSEFASVVEAVECAVAINAEMATRNADLPYKNQVELRIGIDLGDVTVDGDRFSGEGIEVARHVGQHAVPRDICVSRAAHDQVRDKLKHSFNFAGEIDADDLRRPVRVYRLEKGGRRLPKRSGTGRTRIRKGAAALAGCAVILLGVAAAHYLELRVKRAPAAVTSNMQSTALFDEAEGAAEDHLIKMALEVTFWNSIRDAGDPEAIRAYIANYPEGQFTPVARARLVSPQTNGQVENRVTERRTPAVSRDAVIGQWQSEFLAELKRQVLAELQAQEAKELAEWLTIRTSLEPTVLQSYLIKYPEGAYAALARDQMAAAKRQQLSRLQANLETDPRALQSPNALTDDGLTELGLTITIQQHLARLGCDPGRSDGMWGAESRRALRAFARHSKLRLASLTPSEEMLDALSNRKARVCPLVCGPRQVAIESRCVLKTCPDGQALSRSGKCFTRKKHSRIKEKNRNSTSSFKNKNLGSQCGICDPWNSGNSINEDNFIVWCGKRYLRGKALGICL